MKNLLLLSAGAFALASCAPMMGAPSAYTLTPQASAPTGVNPSGTASVAKSSTTTSTSAKISGLAANTYYVGHFHLQGTASTDPCKSAGAPIMSSKVVGQTDAAGMLTLIGTVPNADVAAATYFNVHTAKDSGGAPADDGVACSPVKISM
jgi:superoxide dismutase, Cu-Zn family